MIDTKTDTLSVVVERELPHPPEKIWRALIEPHLIEEWLMKNSFKPALGHQFDLSAEWGKVDCEVQALEPNRLLSYSWKARGLDSVVVWTLMPSDGGTRLRMEQSGFRSEQQPAYQGATQGWPRFLGALEQLLARLD